MIIRAARHDDGNAALFVFLIDDSDSGKSAYCIYDANADMQL